VLMCRQLLGGDTIATNCSAQPSMSCRSRKVVLVVRCCHPSDREVWYVRQQTFATPETVKCRFVLALPSPSRLE